MSTTPTESGVNKPSDPDGPVSQPVDVNDKVDHLLNTSSGNRVFNDPLMLKEIFGYLSESEPIRHYRMINEKSRDTIWELLQQSPTTRLHFGDGCSSQNILWNQENMDKFPFLNVTVRLSCIKPDVNWLIVTHAERIKCLVLIAKITTLGAFKIFLDLLKKLKSLEELALSLTIREDYFTKINWLLNKLTTVRKLSLGHSTLSIYDERESCEMSEAQVQRFMNSFPNVEELESAHPFNDYILKKCKSGFWPRLKALSLRLSDELGENTLTMQLLGGLTQKLEKLKLEGAIHWEPEHFYHPIKTHSQTLTSFKIFTSQVETIVNIHYFPYLKELELNGTEELKMRKMEKLQIECFDIEGDPLAFWWILGLPQLQKLTIALPIYDNFDKFLDNLLPSDPEQLRNIPPNLELKSLEIHIPFSEEGDAWIERFIPKFQWMFSNALLELRKIQY